MLGILYLRLILSPSYRLSFIFLLILYVFVGAIFWAQIVLYFLRQDRDLVWDLFDEIIFDIYHGVLDLTFESILGPFPVYVILVSKHL